MEDDDSLSEENASEFDLASILQYLIRRILSFFPGSGGRLAPLAPNSSRSSLLHNFRLGGQIRILDSEQHNFAPMSLPPPPADANLDNFHKSELNLITRTKAGLPIDDSKDENKCITTMLARRERGFRNGSGFSRAELCRINNYKLPDRVQFVDNYEHKAFCGIYSTDGNKLLTACQDRYLRIYDTSCAQRFKLVQRVQGRDVGWSIVDAAFSRDARYIAYSSWSPSLHLVQVTDDCSSHVALPLCPEERRFCIFSLVFSADGQEILCGSNDGHIYIYDRGSNERTYRVEAHEDDINTVAFADDTSQIIFSGGDDGFCKVWDRRTMSEAFCKPIGVLAGHLDGITYIDSRGDARYLLSNSKDQSIKLWDIRMFSSPAAQENTRKAIVGNKWDYRWQKAPRKLFNKKTNLKGDSSVATYRGHSVLQTLIRCHFSPAFTTGQRYIYTGCALGCILAYDILTGAVVSRLKGHASCVRDVSWHPYRPEIISTSWDFAVMCWSHKGIKLTEGEESEEGDESEEICDERGGGSRTIGEPQLRRSQRIAMRTRAQSSECHLSQS